MARSGMMKLGMSMRGLGYHPAAWRHPEVPADGTLRFEHCAHNAQMVERENLGLKPHVNRYTATRTLSSAAE